MTLVRVGRKLMQRLRREMLTQFPLSGPAGCSQCFYVGVPTGLALRRHILLSSLLHKVKIVMRPHGASYINSRELCGSVTGFLCHLLPNLNHCPSWDPEVGVWRKAML